MRKVLMFNMVSLDGFFEAPDGGIDWHRVDAEFNRFAAAQLDAVGTLLFGRKTYQLMAGYWPTALATGDDPLIAEKMNAKPKVVFSRTLKTAEWENTRLIGEAAFEALGALKGQPGGDLIVLGSAELCAGLLQVGLIDELRLMVNPVVLGGGRPMFAGGPGRVGLELLEARSFANGNVLLRYRPEGRK